MGTSPGSDKKWEQQTLNEKRRKQTGTRECYFVFLKKSIMLK